MNSKRKTMLVAAFVVAVVALAGVGYATAAGTYNATTVNSDNATDNAYLLAEQTAGYKDKFEGTLSLWTYTEYNKTVYSIRDSSAVPGNDNKYGVAIGSTVITLTNQGLTSPTYTISAETGSALPSGWDYILVYDGNATATLNGTSWSAVAVTPTTANSSTTITATLYVAGPAFSTLGTLISPASYANLGSSDTYVGSTALYASLSIAFTVTATVA